MSKATTSIKSRSLNQKFITNDVNTEPVTLARVIRSEWIKFRTLRSTWYVLAVSVIAMILIAILVAYNTRHLSTNLQPDDIGRAAVLQGYYLGQLLIGSLGVLFISAEYTSGQIRATFSAVPKRGTVMLAKLIVFLMFTATIFIPTCIVAFLAGQGFIHNYRVGYSLGDSTALRVVLGTGIYLPLVGVLGGAIAWIVRSTAGSLVAFFGLLLVLPVIFQGLFGTVGKDIYKFLPSGAASAFVASPPDGPVLKPIVGLIVLLIWILGAYLLAIIGLKRRDA